MNSLAEYWKKMDASNPPYVHPEDAPYFKCHRPDDLKHPIIDARSFPQDQRAQNEHFFHFSLLPVPYIGDLEMADVFVLMLNPGFDGHEYAVEAREEVRTALLSTLRQERKNTQYPFWYLDPQQHDHPGYKYWQKRLNETGDIRELSKRIAVLQMMPYHSKTFGADSLVSKLPSAQQAKHYVHNVLVPKANDGLVLLIVARQVRNWGFASQEETSNIVIYKSRHEYRGASLRPWSRGGKAIMRWLHL